MRTVNKVLPSELYPRVWGSGGSTVIGPNQSASATESYCDIQ
jgi:hypothetical protein